jgi:hypothetical protein
MTQSRGHLRHKLSCDHGNFVSVYSVLLLLTADEQAVTMATEFEVHFTSPHFISLHFISLHFISLHFTSLHSTSFHSTSFHFTSFHSTSHHSTSLHFTSLTHPHITYIPKKSELHKIDYFRNTQKAYSMSTLNIRTSWLMLFRKMIGVYCEI